MFLRLIFPQHFFPTTESWSILGCPKCRNITLLSQKRMYDSTSSLWPCRIQSHLSSDLCHGIKQHWCNTRMFSKKFASSSSSQHLFRGDMTSKPPRGESSFSKQVFAGSFNNESYVLEPDRYIGWAIIPADISPFTHISVWAEILRARPL